MCVWVCELRVAGDDMCFVVWDVEDGQIDGQVYCVSIGRVMGTHDESTNSQHCLQEPERRNCEKAC